MARKKSQPTTPPKKDDSLELPPLTPRRKLPTGHEKKRSEQVHKDSRRKREASRTKKTIEEEL